MDHQFDISIIIVSFNCLEPLRECLRSLRLQTGCSYEIIIIDNASSDGTPQFMDSQEIVTIYQGKNIGFGRAANLGARQARGKYILILNPDTVLPPDALRFLHDFAESRPGCGLVSPMLTYPDGAIQLSARKLPRRRDFFVGRGSPLFKLGLTDEEKAGYIIPENDEPLKVPAVSATAVLVPSGLFRNAGYFDQRYFMYLEDIDLCRTLASQGYDIWLAPGIRIVHGWRKSSAKRPYFTAYHHHLSVLKYFLKFEPHRPLYNFILLMALTGGLLVNFLLIAMRKRS